MALYCRSCWCVVGEVGKARGGQRGREEEAEGESESRAVAELNRCAIKRSRGHIKAGLDQGDVTPLLGKIKLMLVFFFSCFFSSSLETGSWLAGCSSEMFGQVPVRQRSWRTEGDVPELWEPSRQTGRQTDGERKKRQSESGEDCLLTGVLLTCYLALHSHTQQHWYSSPLLFTASLECNQLKVRPGSHAL